MARPGNRQDWLVFAAFVAPNVVLFAVFTYWPIIYSLRLSLRRWDLIAPRQQFLGLSNYVGLLSDGKFWHVSLNTLLYAVIVVCAGQVCAFCLALLLNRPARGRGLFRTIAFTPHVATTAAAALIWVLLLHPQYGPLSAVYQLLGVEGPNWLQSSRLALGAVIVVGVWKEIGFASVFFLAGLQGLPADLYEAAAIDGASPIARVRNLTIPLMTPVIFFLMVSGFIAALKAFDIVAIMTEGGPVYPASSTYVFHLYKLAFREYRAGYASAFATIFFLATVLITLLQFRAARRWVHYEA
jgi:ABC-type sugar transport system permease subunit